MTFVRFWMGFTIIGLSVTVLLLLWAFQKKQFKESDRAALLALSDLETENEPPPAMRMSRELAVLIGVFGVGIFVMAASIVVSIMVAEP